MTTVQTALNPPATFRMFKHGKKVLEVTCRSHATVAVEVSASKTRTDSGELDSFTVITPDVVLTYKNGEWN